MTGADEPDDRGADRAAKPERPECQRAYEAYAAYELTTQAYHRKTASQNKGYRKFAIPLLTQPFTTFWNFPYALSKVYNRNQIF